MYGLRPSANGMVSQNVLPDIGAERQSSAVPQVFREAVAGPSNFSLVVTLGRCVFDQDGCVYIVLHRPMLGLTSGIPITDPTTLGSCMDPFEQNK